MLLLASACADFQRGDYWALDEADGGTGEAGDLSYATDIHPLLDAGCERCHAAGNSAGNTGFLLVSANPEASYASVIEWVDLDDPEASRVLGKMAGNGHGGGVIFDDRTSEYALTLAWIEQGAAP